MFLTFNKTVSSGWLSNNISELINLLWLCKSIQPLFHFFIKVDVKNSEPSSLPTFQSEWEGEILIEMKLGFRFPFKPSLKRKRKRKKDQITLELSRKLNQMLTCRFYILTLNYTFRFAIADFYSIHLHRSSLLYLSFIITSRRKL